MPTATPKDVKLVVLGSGGVGKSALSCRFVQGIFVEKYDPTIEDSYRKNVQIPTTKNEKGQQLFERKTLEILDTAGTDQFAAMRELYLKTGDAFLLVYSITSAASFHELNAIYDHIVATKKEGSKTPMVLVGNKSDLSHDRVITIAQGEELAAKWGIKFFETSALRDFNVEAAFMYLPKKIYVERMERAEQDALKRAKQRKCSIV